jgi:hypothetical protein
MGKPNPRKVKRRAEHGRPQARPGQKSQSVDFVEPIFRTEQAIYTAFVGGARALCDEDVRRALQGLIVELGEGHIHTVDPSADDLISCLMRSFRDDRLVCPSDADLVDVLRTILDSIEVWSTPRANSRGYLSYLEGYMKKAGVRCHATALDEPAEPEPSGLLTIGRTWCSGEEGAGAVFRALAEQMMADGQSDEVAETCQQLIGEGPSTDVFRQLSMLAIHARRGFLRRVS